MEAGQGVFNDGYDPVVKACVWPSALQVNSVALPMKTLSWRGAIGEGVGLFPVILPRL